MDAPSTYCIKTLTCRCKTCGTVFCETLPANDELIQFSCGDGQKRFLPTYGPGGYLALLDRFVPEWSTKQTITQQISGRLTQELSNWLPYSVALYSRADIRCPSCGGREVKTEREQTLLNPPVEWLEIP